MADLTILYYTCNFLDETNPYFLNNTKEALIKASGDLPIIIVSQKPTMFGSNSTNIVVGDIGRSHLNIYRQMLIGAKAAKTKYVATGEDDILYSYEHFHSARPHDGFFLYDMCKLSVFTWTKPPLYSFRHNRQVVNQVIVERDLLIEVLEERFARYEELIKQGKKEEQIIKNWGDFGRYEDDRHLGVTVRKTENFMCTCPSIVFTHEFAFGYQFNHGKKKRLGDLRIIEIPYWGKASDVMKLFYKDVH
jgi:hypothetical protein